MRVAAKTGKLNAKVCFEFEHLNLTNQMIVLSAFIQSGYRGTRNHFSILLGSFSVLENKQVSNIYTYGRTELPHLWEARGGL